MKPSKGRAVLLLVLCVIFTLAGIAMMFSGEFRTMLMGFLAVAFFGVGGAWAMIRRFKQPVSYTLTPGGIAIGVGGFVPWQHVGHVAATKTGGAAAVGIEVTDVPAYVATLTPEQQQQAFGALRMANMAGPALGAAGGRHAAQELRSIPTDDLVAAVQWGAERSGGYHVTFPSLNLNKSVDKAVAEIQHYRAQATGSAGPGAQGFPAS